MTKRYDFFTDPGHGWLKVHRQELIYLGIENKITGFSYQKGDYVYLEEDGDASLFAEAWEAKYQVKFDDKFINRRYSDRNSRIRTYEPFKRDNGANSIQIKFKEGKQNATDRRVKAL